MTSVPQQSANLMLWLRSDVGVTESSGSVSQWNDQSGNSNNATQSTGADQPAFVTGALNSGALGTLTFDGSAEFLNLPTDFANLASGCSIFIVGNSTSSVATGNLLSLGNSSNSDAVIAQNVGTQAKMFAYNSSTSSSVVTTDNPLSTGSYQLLEEIYAPGATNGTSTILVNGTQHVQSTSMVSTLNNTSRSGNVIGTAIGAGSNFFAGGIAEILVFSNPLSDSQRAAVESYVLSKYGIGSTPTLDAPTMSPGAGVFTPGQKVSIAQDQNATPYFTIDGTTPSCSSQWLNVVRPIALRW